MVMWFARFINKVLNIGDRAYGDFTLKSVNTKPTSLGVCHILTDAIIKSSTCQQICNQQKAKPRK